jgi:hypothetical protein
MTKNCKQTPPKNEMMVGDGLTQGTKVISHALHLATVVANAEVSLLEGVEPGIKLYNTRLTVAEEMSLNRESHLVCGLRRLLNDLVELGREGAKDLGHHDAV